MTTEQLMVGSAVISAIATAFIAIYTLVSHRLTKAIQADAKRRDAKADALQIQHHQELSDLYQALVVATLKSGPGAGTNMRTLMADFNQYYKGKTEIFKESPQP